ncbi:Adenylyl cyclase class-3/4/guanylyl cyclase [Moorella glycerini]|uniref:Response regulator PleD n=1 Tax=Neomoorella stamsii TaxID=1266720 RepID=A0A9X7J0D1_9FIRM|nr:MULTISPECIES: GGDEF domain-containing protein [Moorella]PRR69563.1 Response regulator PleD [Moorella stamsii]CEP68783.1 Adenylyl cyclase class-3/4/guanylyl cyclase [Moorella glycerini]
MPTNLLLSISVKYWQDFQDTLAKVMDANIYIFDVNGGSFSRFSRPVELCQEVNKGGKICNEKCIRFYKSALRSLEDKGILTCPYGIRLYAYRLGTYAQNIGFLVITSTRIRTQVSGEEENTFVTKAHSIYQTINEVLKAILEQVFSKVEPSSLSIEELMTLPGLTGLEVAPGNEIMVYPLWTALGAVGLLGIVFPVSMDDNGSRNLQIYANFAAVALANAKLIRRLEREAETDFLTGFFNKRALRNILVTELERTIRYSIPLSVIFLDIDDFKTYNDTFGHMAGDVVLQKTAEIIKNSIRTVDIAGRYGGEEFVIILPGTKKEGAVAVAERIRKSIEIYPFPHRHVTVSLGVASAKRNDSIDSLLARADQACYQAKRQGKNRFCLDPS